MTKDAHLWAIVFDDMQRADEVREEIARLGWEKDYLCLLDLAVAVRNVDGNFMMDRQPFPVVTNIVGCTTVGLLAGLVLAAPLTGAVIGAALGTAGTATTVHAGIEPDFIRDVEELMEPGTSALFVLDAEGDMQVILHRIQGLGGTVVKTNVDLERAQLIQSALAGTTAPITAPLV